MLSACSSESGSKAVNLIPRPVNMEVPQGKPGFTIDAHTKILANTDERNTRKTIDFTARMLRRATTYDLSIRGAAPGDTATNVIRFFLDPDNPNFTQQNGYRLTVDEDMVTIRAPKPSGLFYGVQTLRQLLPPEIEYTDPTLIPNDIQWTIPAARIEDYPRFAYRGIHLDVGRHFFPVSFVKKYIDLMALYKMNRFHWHLTEDQGWRIEIKRYPKLTEVGAWRDSTLIGHYGSGRYDGERYGGFYTQEEIREIVAYAGDRFITVIPEIELPGHSSAALAAYPELGCPDKDVKVKTTWGVFEDIYCPKEETFTFLENVLTEVMDLFPTEYIHIGGDEAPKAQWENSEIAQRVMEREGLESEEELQSYFIRRIERFLNQRGKKIIGWDEILEGGLAPNATVMSWRGTEGGVSAARQGHDVIMTPNNDLYFDHYQADPDSEPLAIGGFTTLEDVYRFEPVPTQLTDKEAEHVLGAQGNVWTEYMHSGRKVEYMAYPRALALSEVVWSSKQHKNWTRFRKNLSTHYRRLDIIGVNYARHYE